MDSGKEARNGIKYQQLRLHETKTISVPQKKLLTEEAPTEWDKTDRRLMSRIYEELKKN